jgi:hypothetical protein
MLKYTSIGTAALDKPGFAKSLRVVSSSTPVPASAEVRYRNGTDLSVSHPSLYLYQNLLSEPASKDVAPVVMLSFRYVCLAVTVQDLLVSDPLADIGKARLTRAHFEIDHDQHTTGLLTTSFQ